MPHAVTKILIIDDSETDRYTYRRYLEKSTMEYEVHEAEDGQSGLRLAEHLNPDCILLDIRLRIGESGFEVLQDLVGEHAAVKRTVIVLTVLNLDLLREGALSLGAKDFLIKGLTDASTLDLAVRKAIGHSGTS